MKTIITVLLLIISLIVVDHFQLLQPKAGCSTRLNAALEQLNSILDKGAATLPSEPSSGGVTRTLYQWTDNASSLVISDQPPANTLYETIIPGEEITVSDAVPISGE